MKTLDEVIVQYGIKEVQDFGDVTFFINNLDADNIGLLSEKFCKEPRTYFEFSYATGGMDEITGSGYVMIVFDKKY